MFFLFTFAVSGQTPKTDREENGLKGAVRTVIVTATGSESVNGKWIRKSQLTYNESYDEKGNLILRQNFDYKGNLISRLIYQRIDGEKVARIERFRQDYDPPAPTTPASKVPKTSDPRYDVKYVYKYDGNKIEYTVVNSDNTPGIRVVRTYDEQGNIIRYEQYKPDGKLDFIEESIFNDKGLEKESKTQLGDELSKPKTIYSDNGKTIYSDYEVDWRGNWIKRHADLVGLLDPVPGWTYVRTITYYDGEVAKNNDAHFAGRAPRVIRVSTGVLAERAIKKTEPVYPAEARKAGISGEVMIEVTVDEEGNVATAEGVSGERLLAEAAIAAVRQWKFTVTKIGDVPVRVIGRLRFNFNR